MYDSHVPAPLGDPALITTMRASKGAAEPQTEHQPSLLWATPTLRPGSSVTADAELAARLHAARSCTALRAIAPRAASLQNKPLQVVPLRCLSSPPSSSALRAAQDNR